MTSIVVVVLASVASASTAPAATVPPLAPPPLTAYEPASRYVTACVEFLETGNKAAIAMTNERGVTTSLDCTDYPDAFGIVAERRKMLPRALPAAPTTRPEFIRACADFYETGDTALLGVVDTSASAPVVAVMVCSEYPEALPLIVTRARERSFQAWYATVAKRLGMISDPDDERQCYDYRSLFDGMRVGKFRDPQRRQDLPRVFMKSCHVLYNAN